MPSFFQEYLSRREQPRLVVEMDDYRHKLFAHGPTDKEVENSLVLQVENAMPGNIAAMIAAASKKPQRLVMVPKGAITAPLRVMANGGDVAKSWKPQNILRQTALSMGKLGRVLQMAQDSIPNWNGSRLIIVPAPRVWAEPAHTGIVKVDRSGCGNTFRAGVVGKGLNIQDVGEDPFGPFDMDGETQSDFFNLIKTLQNGFASKPKLVKMYIHAPKSMRPKLKKAKREAAVLRTAYIPPMPMTPSSGQTKGDVWAVRVDERLLGLPIDGVYWPAEDEPLEIRHLEMVEQNEAEVQTGSIGVGDRSQQFESERVQQEGPVTQPTDGN